MEESDIISTGVGWKNDTRRFQNESHEREKCKYYCSCGHSVIIPYQRDKTICSWCKRVIDKKKIDERRYFKDKMRQLLNRREK